MGTEREDATKTAATILLGCGAVSALFVVGVLVLILKLITK